MVEEADINEEDRKREESQLNVAPLLEVINMLSESVVATANDEMKNLVEKRTGELRAIVKEVNGVATAGISVDVLGVLRKGGVVAVKEEEARKDYYGRADGTHYDETAKVLVERALGNLGAIRLISGKKYRVTLIVERVD